MLIVWIVFWWREGSGSLITGTMCVRYIYKKITVVLGLKSRVVTWTIWAGTLVRPDETPQASYGDFIARPRKQASWNSSKHLSTIQQSDQELRTSWAGTLVWSLVFPDETLWVSSCNFSAMPMKTASKNACKNLSTIQRSDQELWTIWAGTLVWPDESPQASHGDLIPTPRKQASWNSCKNLSTIQWSDQEFWPLWAGSLVLSTVWPDQTLTMSSSNFSAAPRKQVSSNSCKNLSTFQRSDQELRTSWAGTLVWFLV